MEATDYRLQLLSMLELVDIEEKNWPDLQVPYQKIITKNNKRRDAYVTELFYQRSILPQVAKEATTIGWCYISDYMGTYFTWFKILLPRALGEALIEPYGTTDSAFISVLQNTTTSKHDFYVVSPFLGEGDQQQVRFELRKVVPKGEERYLSKVSTSTSVIDINAMGKAWKTLSGVAKNVDPVFGRRWMVYESDEKLMELLCQRLLMNKGLKYPVDIDAIEVQQVRQKIIFHEFKRKDSCPQGCILDSINWNESANGYLDNLAKKVKDKYDPKHSTQSDIRALFAAKGYTAVSSAPCYGLDRSHLHTFFFCDRADIEFRHTVWHSFTDRIPSLEDLFSGPEQLLSNPCILTKVLSREDFRGFTFTFNDNSGSFHRKLRVQAAFKAPEFNTEGAMVDSAGFQQIIRNKEEIL